MSEFIFFDDEDEAEIQRLPFSAESWGHPRHYYSEGRGPKYSGDIRHDRSAWERRDHNWVEELLRVDPDAKSCVERTLKRSNNLVREHLRSETGLKLNVGDDSISIPVEVVDGVPPPMAELLGRYDELAPFLLRLPLLRSTVDGLRFLDQSRVYADDILWAVPSTRELVQALPEDGIPNVRRYAEALLKLVSAEDIQHQMLLINTDVMGAYFFRRGRIHLYWMPIVIIARSMGVSIEALTIIVLAHELAHAYTHRGRDIDGHDWTTEAFARADLRIVEGFAQHYAEAICRRLVYREPGLSPAFEQLLQRQSEPYTAYRAWIESGGEAVRGEIMRSGSTPFLRTLTRRPILAARSVHVEAKEVQHAVQARGCRAGAAAWG